MAALVSERFSSTGKLKVQVMVNLNFILHAYSLLFDKMQNCKLSFSRIEL